MSLCKIRLLLLTTAWMLSACDPLSSNAPKTPEELAQRLGEAYAAGDYDGVFALFNPSNASKVDISERLISNLISPGYKPPSTDELEIRLLPLPSAIGSVDGFGDTCPGNYRQYNLEVTGLLQVGNSYKFPYGRYKDRYFMAAFQETPQTAITSDYRITLSVTHAKGAEHQLECAFTEADTQRSHTFSAEDGEASYSTKPSLDGERVIVTTRYLLCASNIESCELRRLGGEGEMTLQLTPPGRGQQEFKQTTEDGVIAYRP